MNSGIRPAEPGELDQLRALDGRVFGKLSYPHFVLRQLFELYRGWWLVAEHGSGLVGYSLGAPAPDRSVAWLLALAVHPDHRRRGLGRQLTLASIALLASAGVPQVYLTVEPDNAVAVGLYRGVGFAVVDRYRDYFGPGLDRVLMVRPCAGPAGDGYRPEHASTPPSRAHRAGSAAAAASVGGAAADDPG